MQLHEVQDNLKTLLLADAQIAPFAPIFIETEETDPQAVATAIDEGLAAREVFIGIGDISGGEQADASSGRRVVAAVPVTLYVFERGSSHTPAGMALVARIVRAVLNDENEDFQFQGFDRGANEKGGTCIAIDFTASVQLGL